MQFRAAIVGLVMVLAAWLFLPGIAQPRQMVWDETWYIASTARYELGQTQFASHPPLGMMLIAAGNRASGLNAGTDWKPLAAERGVAQARLPKDFDYRGVRLAPALFGVLAAGLFALLMLQLTGSGAAAALLSLLFLADGALVVQMRSAQLDAFQLAFLLGALNAFVLALRRPGWGWTALFGLLLIAAALVRANALVVGVLAPFLLWPMLSGRDWRALAARIAAGLGGGIAALALTGAAFIAMSPNPTDQATPFGRDQAPFIMDKQNSTGESSAWSANAILTFASGYRAFMANDLAITPKSDANGTHPQDWILGRGFTLYAFDRSGGALRAIGLMPNMIAWLIALAGVAVSLLPSRWRGDPLRAALLLGWIGNMAAFAWLDSQRVLYTYHYLMPLMFGHALVALELERWGWRRPLVLALAGLVLAFGTATRPLATASPAPEWLCGLIGGGCATG